MRIVLATSNKGKIKEISSMLENKVLSFADVIEPFEIEENGTTFAQNAYIKARAVYKAISDKDTIVISDDSGISVPALNGEPGIYSARYAKIGASDEENRLKLIGELKKIGIRKTPAFYTAAIAIVSSKGEFCTHGWMHGEVIDEMRGINGFGYDSLFIPKGFDKTLGELDNEIKASISHRFFALSWAKVILNTIK